MGKEILTRCGYRCDLCLAYKENIEKEDKRQQLSDGWYKLYGFRIEAKDIYCEGCISDNCLKANLIDKGCPVRPCVINRRYENCSQCNEFVCSKLKERIVKYEDLQSKRTEKIKNQERKYFIKPYENYDRLNKLRESNGQYSRMFNQLIVPSELDMTKFIENQDVITFWTLFNKYIDTNYSLDKSIKFGGKNYGWELQYKYGKRTIVSIYPERKAFTILYTLGKKEVEEHNKRREEISEMANNLIDSTEQYHDGKWLWLRITKKTQIDDALVLLDIKRKPRKK